MPKLIKEFEIHPDVKIDEIDVVGLGPFGLRMISNVTGGEIVGNRLKGTIVGPGGDWVLRPGRIRPNRRAAHLQDR